MFSGLAARQGGQPVLLLEVLKPVVGGFRLLLHLLLLLLLLRHIRRWRHRPDELRMRWHQWR